VQEEKRTRTVGALEVVDEEISFERVENDWSKVPVENVVAAKWKEIGVQDEFATYEPITVKHAKETKHKHISGKWHLTLDPTVDGGVKARWVAREFNKGEGRGDFFAVTSSSNHDRLIDYWAVQFFLITFVFDCSRAFLHIPEHERVTVDCPAEWLEHERAQGRHLEPTVWKMHKMLYGRRAAPQAWTLWLAKLLRDTAGLEHNEAVPSFFRLPGGQLKLEVHMDEGHGVCTMAEYEAFREAMRPVVAIKFAGPFSTGSSYSFLGVVRERYEHCTVLRPATAYIDDIVKDLNLEKAKTVVTPGMEFGLEPEELIPLSPRSHGTYRGVVGKSLYYSRWRPELLYSIKELGRWLHQPCGGMFRALKRLGRYLAGHRNQCIAIYRADALPGGDPAKKIFPVVGVSDTNWATCRRTRKSTGCFHISVGYCSPLMTVSRTQTVVADSSGVAEWYGGVSCSAELLFVCQLLRWMGMETKPIVCLDSSAAIAIGKRLGVGKLRTLEVKTLWLQQFLHRDELFIKKVAGEQNVADLGTKHLPQDRLDRLTRMAGGVTLAPGERPPAEGQQCVHVDFR